MLIWWWPVKAAHVVEAVEVVEEVVLANKDLVVAVKTMNVVQEEGMAGATEAARAFARGERNPGRERRAFGVYRLRSMRP